MGLIMAVKSKLQPSLRLVMSWRISIANTVKANMPTNANSTDSHLQLSAASYLTRCEGSASSWSLAEADYSRTVGLDLELCRVIVILDQSSNVVVLRKLPFKKTNVDVPAVTL